LPSQIGRADALKKAGTDGAGLQDWGQLDGVPNQSLTGIVGLGQIGSDVYAATNFDVYRRPANGSTGWVTITTGQVRPITPLCMSVIGGKLYVGSGHGLWRFDDPAWVSVSDLKALVLQIAQSSFNFGANTTVSAHAITLISLRYRELFSIPGTAGPDPIWSTHNLNNATNHQQITSLITAVAAVGGDIYIGTLDEGIWTAQATGHNLPNKRTTFSEWTQVAALPADVAVTCVSCDGNELLAGTTAGLRRYVLNGGNWTLQPDAPNSPAVVAVTSILRDSGEVFVGADGHVWKRELDQSWNSNPFPLL
jgi:ligand-binding sensor domain-containing protein